MQALNLFRQKAAGVADLLNYAALVESGVVMCKDGSLLAGFTYRGDDAGSATASDRNWLTARVNQAIARFGSGWVTWNDAARLPSPGYPPREASHFPDPITRLIEEERRLGFEGGAQTHFESEYALILQYTPPLRRNTKVTDMIYDDDGGDDVSPADRVLAYFVKTLDDLQDALGDLVRLRRMRGYSFTDAHGIEHLRDELVNYLRFAMTGETVEINIPPIPMYLDALLGAPELFPGDTPKLGDKFIAAVAIEGFPAESYPGMLDMLDGLAIPYRWSTRFIYLDQHEAIAQLKRYRLKWQQKIRGFFSQVFKTNKGMVNTDAVEMTAMAENAISEASSGLVTYGYYTPVVVLMDERRDRLQEYARYVKREIERLGFVARIETVNAMEAWLGTLPGHPHPNVRRPLVHTLNLADLLPLTAVWPGLAVNPCNLYPPNSPPLLQAVTTGATPFRLNLHVNDVGHTLIFGPTGAGKSTLLATIAAQFRRYPRATITAFDKGHSMFGLVKSVGAGASHYDIGGEHEAVPAFAPLRDIDTPMDLAWAEEWIATLYELQTRVPPGARQKEEIHRAMALLQAAPLDGRSLTHFVATVQDPDLRGALNHYTVSGAVGHLLDGEHDQLQLDTFTVFEIDELMKAGDANAIPVLLYLFRRFERSLRGQPAMLILDEAWVMLGHPVFREKLRSWLKEMRKKNCLVVLATQSLSDATASGLLDVLMEQCPTKLLLPNPEADKGGTKEHPGPRDLYALFGLNDREVQLLKFATPKRQYYYTSPLGRRVFELGLGPVALSFVAVADKESVASIRDLSTRYGQEWPFVWLNQRGVTYETLQ